MGARPKPTFLHTTKTLGGIPSLGSCSLESTQRKLKTSTLSFRFTIDVLELSSPLSYFLNYFFAVVCKA